MLTSAPAAHADVYSVFSCRDPLGPANAAAGWSGTTSGSGTVSNGCAQGGALTAALAQPRPEGNASASWTFAAPPGTKIVRFHARRTTTGLAKSLLASDLAYIVETDTATLEKCAPPTESSCIADLSEPIQKEGLNGSWVRFRAICTNAGDFCSSPLRIDTTQVNIGLQDLFAPTVAHAKVLDDGDQSGELTVGFDAADLGGGLYRMIVKVDGKVAQAVSAGGKCADALATDADPYQFDVPVPCPLVATGAKAQVDVRTLAPGAHGVELAIEDAAGNQTAIYGPTEFPRANGANASTKATLKMWFAKGTAPAWHEDDEPARPPGRDARGSCATSAARGIQGARIDVYHVRKGKRKLLKTGLKTRANGQLTLILPNNVDTRSIEFAYRALRPGPITSRKTLRLNVVKRNGNALPRALIARGRLGHRLAATAATLDHPCRRSSSTTSSPPRPTSRTRSRRSPRRCAPAIASRRCSARPGTGKTMTMAGVIQELQRPTLVLAHNKTLAAQLCNEFRTFFPDNAVEYFVSYYDYYQPEAYVPSRDLYIEKDSAINEEVDRLRHAATAALFARRDVIIVASVSAIFGLGSPETYEMNMQVLRKGDIIDRDALLRKLVSIQYTRNDTALGRGSFRVRGETLEVFPAYEETAFRATLFGDEVERLQHFDPLTGELIADDLEHVAVWPATHYNVKDGSIEAAVTEIARELNERTAELEAQGKLLESHRLRQRTQYDMEMLREMGFCNGIENYSRILDGRAAGRAAVLPDRLLPRATS